jgi:signal transduction histidine kinase
LEEIDALDEMIRDMQFSIERMKSYSVLVSDLSAGKRLEPNLSVTRMSEAIENAASFLESEARKSGIEIRYEIQKDAPPVLHDEMYVSRIVQNLVSNAIRAVRDKLPDELEEAAFEEDVTIDFVTISYRFEDNRHILEVLDNGLGMPAETVERVLAGTASSRWTDSSGSGWGTKIVLELAAAQDAKVEVDSTVGQGTTFRVIFPA